MTTGSKARIETVSKNRHKNENILSQSNMWTYIMCVSTVWVYLGTAQSQSYQWTPRQQDPQSASCPSPFHPSGRQCSSDSHSPQSGQTCLQYRWRSHQHWDRCSHAPVHTNTSNEHIFVPLLISQSEIQRQCQAPAEVGEEWVVISGVEASISDDNYSDVSFGSAAVPDQVVVGILQSRWSPGSSSNPLQTFHCILDSGEVVHDVKSVLSVNTKDSHPSFLQMPSLYIWSCQSFWKPKLVLWDTAHTVC